jgi:hypothetical protein
MDQLAARRLLIPLRLDFSCCPEVQPCIWKNQPSQGCDNRLFGQENPLHSCILKKIAGFLNDLVGFA